MARRVNATCSKVNRQIRTLVSDMTQNEVSQQIDITTPTPSSDAAQGVRARHWRVAAILAVAVIGVLFFGIRSRLKAETNLAKVTAQLALPSVSVVAPKQTAPAQEIVLPGNVQPYIS